MGRYIIRGSRRRLSLVNTSSPEPYVPNKIYAFGSAELIDGAVSVSFEPEFTDALAGNIPIVIATPRADCNGLIISETTADGFTVLEARGGSSNVTFNWIAIARTIKSREKPGDFGMIERPDGEAYFDESGNQIPPEWVEDMKKAGVRMFTEEEVHERYYQDLLFSGDDKTVFEGKPVDEMGYWLPEDKIEAFYSEHGYLRDRLGNYIRESDEHAEARRVTEEDPNDPDWRPHDPNDPNYIESPEPVPTDVGKDNAVPNAE